MTTDRPTILVVDDEHENLKLVARIFHRDYEVIETDDSAEALEILRSRAPATIAIVEDGTMGLRSVRATATAATNITLGRDELSFMVVAPAAGIVVVNEAFYPGWQAEVTGVATNIERVNGLVRGIRVPEGRHHITMRFEPADGAPLRWLLLLSLLATAAIAMFSSRRG